MFGNSKRETCSPQTFGHRPIYIAAKPPLMSLPRMGKGDREAVDRVLS